MKTRLDDEACV